MAMPKSGSDEPNLIPCRRPRLPPTEALERGMAFRAEMASRRSVRMFPADPVRRVLVELAIMTAASAPPAPISNHGPFVPS
jgi:hypothetical protein